MATRTGQTELQQLVAGAGRRTVEPAFGGRPVGISRDDRDCSLTVSVPDRRAR